MITVGPVSVAEAAALFDEYRAHYGHTSASHDWLARSGLSVTAAADGSRLCGIVTTVVLPASLTLGEFWMIRDLYVTPSHRRTGVAQALLTHVIEAARAAGAVRVSLQTETSNEAALALYERFGFAPMTGLEQLSLPLR